MDKIANEIDSIADVVRMVVEKTDASANGGAGGDVLDLLEGYRQRLLEAGDRGRELAAQGRGVDDREWGAWKQTLPPIAFDIARETKELIQRVDRADDFS